MTSETPPWVKRPSEANLWVTAARAAREYFRVSDRHVRRQCADGDMTGIFATFFDGRKWWIKLPEPLRKQRT